MTTTVKKNRKPFWQMTIAELREATKAFGDPAYQPRAIQPTPADLAQQRRARRRGGRPPPP
jgi:hypothetical protein